MFAVALALNPRLVSICCDVTLLRTSRTIARTPLLHPQISANDFLHNLLSAKYIQEKAPVYLRETYTRYRKGEETRGGDQLAQFASYHQDYSTGCRQA
jgi:hypothetical protein